MEISRVPVCPRCLREPQPLEAEYFCSSCRTPFLSRYPLDSEGRCGLCRRGLRGFDAAYCYGAYEGALRGLIHLFKYGKVKTLAEPLGGLLAEAMPCDERFDLVTAVPLYWRREWQRGFNQSQLLAGVLARRTGVAAVSLLRRVRSTAVQAGLNNSSRRRNVAGAFEPKGRARALAAGKQILLIDDVMTTGSTAASCALALKRAGAARVALMTVARVDRRLGAARAAHDFAFEGAY